MQFILLHFSSVWEHLQIRMVCCRFHLASAGLSRTIQRSVYAPRCCQLPPWDEETDWFRSYHSLWWAALHLPTCKSHSFL